MRTSTAIRRGARLLASAVLVLGLSACDAKLDDFFQPTSGTPGGGDEFPTASDLDGVPITVNYNTLFTDCEASLPNFQADADMTTSGTNPVTLNVLFFDAPVPIAGAYTESNGSYMGETVPVDVGGGAFAVEEWDGQFTKSGSSIFYSGTSDVTVSGSFDCTREFSVSFNYTF